MPQPLTDEALLRKTIETWLKCRADGERWPNAAAARRLKMVRQTFDTRLAKAILRIGKEYGLSETDVNAHQRRKEVVEQGNGDLRFLIEHPPSAELSAEELIQYKKRKFEKLAANEDAKKLIRVSIREPGPIGVLHFGDPHIDDDGCDIHALERHRELCITTPGLYGANVGDVTNNWVGRLAKLYAHQSTTQSEAWTLAEWLLSGDYLLYLVGGNHDGWSGEGDPLKWIMRQEQAIFQSSEVRVELALPSGHKPRINCRHDFAGSSQWNPAHGPMKSVFHGVRDHVAVCGHKHKSGYGIIKDPLSGIACHAIQVSSYKFFDRYARDHGFRDQHLSPCAVTTFNTLLPDTDPDFVKVFWNAEEGADYLTYLRKRAGV